MKKISKLISAAAVVALSGAIAFGAVDEGNGKAWGHGHRMGVMTARLARKLNLTDAQKDQLKAFRQSFREENRAFFESARQTRKDYRAAKQAGDTEKMAELKSVMQSQHAQMKQLHQQSEQQLVSILTPEQRAQYDAFKAERAARRAERQQKQR
jgi:protein CpxP